MKKFLFACVAAACAVAGACVGYESKSSITNPTTTAASLDALVGTWTSASTGIIPSPSSCTDFKWNPVQQTPTSALGSFSATCAGDLKVSGTASGTLAGTTIAWNATGVATTPTIPSCAISLTGTAELGVNSIRVPYSGNTCLGPVSGVEILNKK